MSKDQYEVIIADDGTFPDLLQPLLSEFGKLLDLKCVVNPRSDAELSVFRNPAKVRNLGMQSSRGDVVLMHAGDILPARPNTLSYILSKHSGTADAIVRGNLISLGPKDTGTVISGSKLPLGIPEGRCMPYGSRSFRKSSAQRIGGFSEAFVGWGVEDSDFDYRAALAGIPTDEDPEILYLHLFHPLEPRREAQRHLNIARWSLIRSTESPMSVNSDLSKDLRITGNVPCDCRYRLQIQELNSANFKFSGVLFPGLQSGVVAFVADRLFHPIFKIHLHRTPRLVLVTSNFLSLSKDFSGDGPLSIQFEKSDCSVLLSVNGDSKKFSVPSSLHTHLRFKDSAYFVVGKVEQGVIPDPSNSSWGDAQVSEC